MKNIVHLQQISPIIVSIVFSFQNSKSLGLIY